MVEALLEDGLDLTYRVTEFEWSPLDDAVAGGTENILWMIINHGAEVDSPGSDGHTALHIAAIHMLVEAGADIHAGNINMAIPLHAAAEGVAPEACLALLKFGADLNAKIRGGETALHRVAPKAAHRDAVQMVDLLLRWGADETAVCSNGRTAEDMIGTRHVYRRHSIPDSTERVRTLLARAPADRAWRRRGLLALCRASPAGRRLGRFRCLGSWAGGGWSVSEDRGVSLNQVCDALSAVIGGHPSRAFSAEDCPDDKPSMRLP